MHLYLAKLRFSAPVHFGEVGIGIENAEEILHSDSLFSGICHAWAALYGKSSLEEMLSEFISDPPAEPPFLISSAFVFKGETYFLPKPYIPSPGFANPEVREKYGKILKSLSHLPFEFFSQWVHNEPIDYEELGAKANYRSAYSFYLAPRVALDRATSNSSIYHCRLVRFAEDSGLYCLVKLNKPDIAFKLRSVLSVLGEMGVGGERTSGCGVFYLEWSEAAQRWKDMLKNESKGFCTLSLYHPEKGVDLNRLSQDASYALLERRGWIASPFVKKSYKRKTVVMFSEGSVFKMPIRGNLINVTPQIWEEVGDHRIYRYGFAFPVGITLSQKEKEGEA